MQNTTKRVLFVTPQEIIVTDATLHPTMAQNDQLDIQDELDTASAILSLSGPCRNIGDIYLTCVATRGLGQCRPLRAGFESCTKETAKNSRAMLGSIGGQMFPEADKEEDQALGAARMINRQLFQPS